MIKWPEVEEFIKIFSVLLIKIWQTKCLQGLDKLCLLVAICHDINIHIIDNDL